MGVLGKFESKVEGAVDGAAAAMFSSPIEPAQIAKKAEKQMKREKLVGSGRQYAPTLYNVLVNERDDKRLFGFYPTMASEIENYLYAKGTDAGMEFDTRPLVRFIPDPGLKKGRFDVIAEVVSAPIIKKLRIEEQEYYGLAPKGSAAAAEAEQQAQARVQAAPSPRKANAGAYGQASEQNRAPYGADPHASAQGKFAGLDVAADVDDLSNPVYEGASMPRQSDASLDGLPGFGGGGRAAACVGEGAAGAAVGAGMAGAALNGGKRASDLRAGAAGMSTDSADSLAVIGNASLYNLVEQRSYLLKSRKLTLGRGKDNDITLADANASRVHARLSQDATGTWKLTDLGSTNGTQLNGRDVTSAILRHGDEILIGTTALRFNE